MVNEMINKREKIAIDDVGEGPMVLINPEILETAGEQTGDEGCLSVPGLAGQVTRPNYVKARAFNENMEEYEIEGTELLARAICHELDHLDGHLYVEKVEGELLEATYDDYEDVKKKVKPLSEDDVLNKLEELYPTKEVTNLSSHGGLYMKLVRLSVSKNITIEKYLVRHGYKPTKSQDVYRLVFVLILGELLPYGNNSQ